MPFSQIIPPSPSPSESKSPLYTSVSFLLSCIQGRHCHLSKKSLNSLALSLLYGPTLTLIHDYWKNHCFDYMDLCWQSARCVIAFLPRSKHLLISSLQSLTSDFGAQENNICHCFHFFPVCREMMRPDIMISVFFNVESQVSFFFLLFHLHQEAL